jgi:hypothetical protein
VHLDDGNRCFGLVDGLDSGFAGTARHWTSEHQKKHFHQGSNKGAQVFTIQCHLYLVLFRAQGISGS